MGENKNISLIECPRDAMQGWKNFIPTTKKIEYINALLQVGFDTIDFGSFVSAKVIPQMADTKDVLKGLQVDKSTTKLLAIIASNFVVDLSTCKPFNTSFVSAICGITFAETKLPKSIVSNPTCNNALMYSIFLVVGIKFFQPCIASRGHSI